VIVVDEVHAIFCVSGCRLYLYWMIALIE